MASLFLPQICPKTHSTHTCLCLSGSWCLEYSKCHVLYPCGFLSLLSLSQQINKKSASKTDVVSLSASGIIQKRHRFTHVSVLSVPGIFEIRHSQGYGLSFSLFAGNNQRASCKALCGFSLSALRSLKRLGFSLMGFLPLMPWEGSKDNPVRVMSSFFLFVSK